MLTVFIQSKNMILWLNKPTLHYYIIEFIKSIAYTFWCLHFFLTKAIPFSRGLDISVDYSYELVCFVNQMSLTNV